MRSVGKLHRGKFGKCNLYDQHGFLIATTRNAPQKAKVNQTNAQYFLECWNAFEEEGLVGEMVGTLRQSLIGLEYCYSNHELDSKDKEVITINMEQVKAVLTKAEEVGG